ncbi:MAG TPA: cytochrome C oxidase subunit IV family protein [Terriglobales bacterium]|nr:cytochrome C oxidase subunit IV family protein [Terriglobales bacterium]
MAAEHIVPKRTYFAIWTALLILTGITAYVSTLNLHVVSGLHDISLNAAAALLIASLKASLVVLFFMHLKYSPRLTAVVVFAAIFWLAILLTLSMADYLTRGLPALAR